MKLIVNLENNSYSIFIKSGILADAEQYISQVFKGRRIMIISDDNVFPLYGKILIEALPSFECCSLILPHGELSKSFQMLPRVYASMLENHITRSDLVIALGGGVIGDLVGFAASSYLRGIPLVQIPTSLLAQVDSSVGGKVAVDLPEGKNLVGAFYQPKLVLIDPNVLSTLPQRFITDGMGEVIKYGCIRDSTLFQTLSAHESFAGLNNQLESIIYRCIDIKRKIVEKDPFDMGERMHLNFGHTLAHTIEQHYQYERESHGEAVAIGMYQITKIAEKAGLTKSGESKRIHKVLKKYGLPTDCGLSISSLTDAIMLDKKNLNSHLNVVLLHEIGSSYVYPTTLSFFKNAGII